MAVAAHGFAPRTWLLVLAVLALQFGQGFGGDESDSTEAAKEACDVDEAGDEVGAKVSGWLVLQYTLTMALMSGLGGVPFLFVMPDKMDSMWLGCANAMASGVTLAASFGLLYEGVYSDDFEGHYLLVVLGMFLGYALIAICEAKLDDKNVTMYDTAAYVVKPATKKKRNSLIEHIARGML